MTVTELIELLKPLEFGGATGKPREKGGFNEQLTAILAEHIEQNVRNGMRFGAKQEREKIAIFPFSIDEPVGEIYDETMQLIIADRKRVALEAVKAYEDDLLRTLDDISNKPWRAARHIRKLYEKNTASDTELYKTKWYKEVAGDWGLLEEFFSNGGMNKVRELMADPKFNVNYPERIAELKAQQEEV